MPFLQTARTVFTVLGGLYVATIVLLTIPYFQTHTFMHAVSIPWFSNFDIPEKYGLAPNKTINLKIQTADNETLGAWFVLSDPYYHSLPAVPSEQPIDHIPAALKGRPTILFFHGNAATRAFNARIQHYSLFSSRLAVNVLAIDYRGYGDSTGSPTEAGLALDARAAWNWLITNGATADQILIVGHSLGTGVSALLSAQLSDEKISPRGVVLLSPFSSIAKVLDTYSVFGVIPLIKPLAMVPWVATLVKRAIIHRFDTEALIPRMKGPILIAHAENDWEIPYTHSEALFNTFLDPLLPSLPSFPSNTLSKDEWAAFTEQFSKRKEAKKEIVSTVELHNFGTVQEGVESGRRIVLLTTLAGGHDYLGVQEGVQDVIGRTFGFFE
ncbi:Alpha/Beta hydrolase protein [Mycena metata]|uniref:Alpha/Beta hydrolase protein n=1 Tax=Mycena metata TaxID=1033252 RepID=A0AAD7HPQ9_9AGAR|nr:Alpha/Beta hydrolase protein [Mycena metata]